MTTEFPLNIFPTQIFPDAELKRISLEATALTIAVSNSEWGFSEDGILFYGTGSMTFHYAGKASPGWRKVHETSWHEGGPELLAHSTALEFIRRQADDSWLFQFSSREQGFVVCLLLEKISRIDWTGEANQKLLQLLQPPADETPAGETPSGDAPAGDTPAA